MQPFFGELMNFRGRAVVMTRMEEFSIYRGETRDHGSLCSGLHRINDVYEKAMWLAKLKEFEHLILQSPAVREIVEGGMPVHAIAQQFGMKTEYLDFSGSFAVAMFFATCKWDHDEGWWRPLNQSEIDKNPVGVVYTMFALDRNEDDFDIVGTVALNRPSLQYPYLYRDNGDNNIGRQVSRIDFWHSTELSEEIYEMFSGGLDIYPPTDSGMLQYIVRQVSNCAAVNRGLYLEGCRELGLDDDNETLYPGIGDYILVDDLPTLSENEISILDAEIRSCNFFENTGMPVMTRLCYCKGIPD